MCRGAFTAAASNNLADARVDRYAGIGSDARANRIGRDEINYFFPSLSCALALPPLESSRPLSSLSLSLSSHVAGEDPLTLAHLLRPTLSFAVASLVSSVPIPTCYLAFRRPARVLIRTIRLPAGLLGSLGQVKRCNRSECVQSLSLV